MKGADQCPRCASRKWVELPAEGQSFYANVLRRCSNCKTFWEPFDEADLLDEGGRYSSFRKACDNCAFRPGSPERTDPEKWEALLGKLGWDEGYFYCHKGVAIDFESEDGFAYPINRKKLRPCRGFLAWLNGMDLKARIAASELGEGK